MSRETSWGEAQQKAQQAGLGAQISRAPDTGPENMPTMEIIGAYVMELQSSATRLENRIMGHANALGATLPNDPRGPEVRPVDASLRGVLLDINRTMDNIHTMLTRIGG